MSVRVAFFVFRGDMDLYRIGNEVGEEGGGEAGDYGGDGEGLQGCEEGRALPGEADKGGEYGVEVSGEEEVALEVEEGYCTGGVEGEGDKELAGALYAAGIAEGGGRFRRCRRG